MTNILRSALLGLCIVFVVAIAAELIFAIPWKTNSPNVPDLTRERIRPPATERVDRLAAEILKRPLFIEGRQPPELKIKKPEPPKLQGRLAGMAMRPDMREALFTRPGGRPIAVKEGDVIDGWTVNTIKSDRVVLTSTFGEQVVKPTYAAADEIAPPKPRAAAKKPASTQSAPARPIVQLQKVSGVQLTQGVARAGSIGP